MMKFSDMFVIILWCTLYISVISTTENYENIVIEPADETLRDTMENRSEESSLERDDNFVFPLPDDSIATDIQNSFESDPSDVQRGSKGKKKASPRNCMDLKKQGKPTGTYSIIPCDSTSTRFVNVYCDMDSDGGGWTVIQRRGNYHVQENFYNTWNEYMLGFGDPTKDFWLGNDNIHCLTKQSYNELRIDLENWTGSIRYAKYGFFYVDDRSQKYNMEVQDYNGTAGDSLAYHNNNKFSTFDADNDPDKRNCAALSTGAWWYNSCQHSNLNGMYNGSSYKGVKWYHFGGEASLKTSEMKIRPKHY